LTSRWAGVVLPSVVLGLLALVAGGLALFPDVVSRVRQQGTYARAPEACRVGWEPCTATFLDGSTVTLSIEPQGLPTETPLTFRVDVQGAAARPVALELQGVDMNMGIVRFPLDGDGRGTGVIPLCTTSEMRWRADVVLSDRTAGFGFSLTRQHNPVLEATYPNFVLDSAEGPLSLDDLRGRVVAVYFGYTSCPDFCPTTLQTLARARSLLPPEEQERFTALMVSLDPGRDLPDHLAEYVGFFDPSFRGVTGTPQQVAEVASSWGVAWRRVDLQDSAVGYVVDHDTRAFLVAPDGHMVGSLRHGTDAESIARQVQSLF
jgi:protein SCO1/2